MSFGTQLKSARKVAGMTQEKLAVVAGLDRTYISDLERDVQRPSFDTIIQLCKGLEILPSRFVARLEKELPQFDPMRSGKARSGKPIGSKKVKPDQVIRKR
jgi:transcriptional regulator with XRE-family HTH domain